MTKTAKFILLFTMLIISLSACGGSSLVGTWEVTSIEFSFQGENISEYLDSGDSTFQFFSNGTGILTEFGFTSNFFWSINGRSLEIIDGTEVLTIDYNIIGPNLTLTYHVHYLEGFTSITTLRRAGR